MTGNGGATFYETINIDKLVHLQATSDVNSAIAREKQIKGWLISKKIALIKSSNPEWRDLADELFQK